MLLVARTENAALLASAQSLAADGILEAGERWGFIVVDCLSRGPGLTPNDFERVEIGSLSEHRCGTPNDGRLE